MNHEQLKQTIRKKMNVCRDYDLQEIVAAILKNDTAFLDELRNRQKLLDAEYKRFVEDIDSKDKDRKKVAIGSFKRPKK